MASLTNSSMRPAGASPAGVDAPHIQTLSSVDATCLPLCSRQLMAFLFHKLFNKPLPTCSAGRPVEEPPIALLTRSCRDLPQLPPLFACVRLHLWQHISPPRPGFKLRDCYYTPSHNHIHLTQPLFWGHHPNYSYFGFHFVHLHFATRRFYFGPLYGIPAESLRYTEVRGGRKRSPGCCGKFAWPPPLLECLVLLASLVVTSIVAEFLQRLYPFPQFVAIPTNN